MFKATYTIIHNRGCTTVQAMDRSPKRAFQAAKSKAWDEYSRTESTNWADCWLEMVSPYGRLIFNNFTSY